MTESGRGNNAIGMIGWLRIKQSLCLFFLSFGPTKVNMKYPTHEGSRAEKLIVFKSGEN